MGCLDAFSSAAGGALLLQGHGNYSAGSITHSLWCPLLCVPHFLWKMTEQREGLTL